VVGGHDLLSCHGVGVDVGDVALQPGEVLGAFDEVPVDGGVSVGDLDKPVLLQRAFAVGDGLGASDHGVDGLDVIAVPLE